MTRDEFIQWCRAESDDVFDSDEAEVSNREENARTLRECGELAQRLGLHEVFAKCRPRSTQIDAVTVKTILSQAIAAAMLLPADAGEPAEKDQQMDADAAAVYLGTTRAGVYGLVKREQLNPLRGPGESYRFTKPMLDTYLSRKKKPVKKAK